ncbi:MAG TPA: hypothetical protein PLK35_03555 [Candidatus Moranbacteria bacterium]|nr:hypothetical protein [Candidatus Moranbacteria bacterium]
MEYNEETNEQNPMDEEETQGFKQWFQDNLRIIISVAIVVIIAGGIYSYSKRSETSIVADQEEQSDVVGKIAGTADEDSGEPAVVEEGVKAETPKQEEAKKEEVKTQDRTSSIATSQETEKSFVETAVRGDGTTKLARRALANYLEKNPDSSLTAEHKIYIEDYLRKRVANKGKVNIGTSVEFEKSLIQDAISKSKNLNEKQLQNLHKYAVRVPSLS